jgi:GNAT superfamily N-acetyltransferase
MNTRVRAATPADLPVIAELIRELAAYEKLSSAVCFDTAELTDNLFGPRPYAEVLIAEVDDSVQAFALFFHNFSTFLGRPGIYLEDLFVRPAARRQGLGRALLSTLAQIALERKCGRLEWSVLDWNTDAITFYRGLGAEMLEEWTGARVTGDALTVLARAGAGLHSGSPVK